VSEEAPAPGTDGLAELVGKLAHEVRGPVATLRGLAGTALAHYDGLSDDERREFLGLIRTEAERLERAVEQSALAMRLDAGSVRFDLGRHDLAAVARAVVETEDVGDRRVDVRAEGPIEAIVDVSHLTTVLRQLVRNAATFSPPDATVVVAVRREGDDAVIEVSDGGPGIPPDRRAEVFERFARWRPPGYETAPGTGLGLFIARELVRGHGGTISMGDARGGGTMLAVRIPLEGSRGNAR
jgi:signal transduction histidine kinase